MVSRREWFAVAAAAAVFAALAVAAVVEPGPLPGELGVVRWLQDRPQPVEAIADAVRVATGTEVTLLVGIAPAVWLIARNPARGLLAVAIAVVTMLVGQPLMKRIVDRPRPSPALVEVRAEHTSLSFPSGHSIGTTAVWGAAALLAAHFGHRRLAPVLLVPVVLTGAASSVQGVHWPSDAIAGTLFGAFAALAILVVTTRPLGRRRPLSG